MSATRPSILAFSLLVLGCGGEEIIISDGGVAEAVVRGTVIDQLGAPVPGARLDGTVWRGGCPPSQDLVFGPYLWGETDSNGAFAETVSLPFEEPFLGCVLIEVRPQDSSGLEPIEIEVEVDFRSVTVPPDTAEVAAVVN